MSCPEPRNVTPLLQMLRNFLLGRCYTNALRFRREVADRTQPSPCLPDGPHYRLFANYYYCRDARREVDPPKVLAIGSKLLLCKEMTTEETRVRRPGCIYQWDSYIC